MTTAVLFLSWTQARLWDTSMFVSVASGSFSYSRRWVDHHSWIHSAWQSTTRCGLTMTVGVKTAILAPPLSYCGRTGTCNCNVVFRGPLTNVWVYICLNIFEICYTDELKKCHILYSSETLWCFWRFQKCCIYLTHPYIFRYVYLNAACLKWVNGNAGFAWCLSVSRWQSNLAVFMNYHGHTDSCNSSILSHKRISQPKGIESFTVGGYYVCLEDNTEIF